jgi:hypothetical protein
MLIMVTIMIVMDFIIISLLIPRPLLLFLMQSVLSTMDAFLVLLIHVIHLYVYLFLVVVVRQQLPLVAQHLE